MKFRWFYILPIFLVCIMGYSFFVKWGKVHHISFETKNFWLKEDQREKLIHSLEQKIKPYIGVWIWQLSMNQLSQLVKTHPQVEEVQVFRSWPNRFVVHLVSDPPILLLLGNKWYHPVTKTGKILHPIPISDIPDVPILRGKIFFKHLEWRKKVIQLFQHLPKKGIFSQNNISEIKYSTKDSDFYLYLVQNSSPIRIGEWLPEFRPDHIESVLKYLKQKKIKWRVIDARFSQKVVVSLDKGS